MKIIVNMPEEVIESLGGQEAAEKALLERLNALPEYDPTDRIIVLGRTARQELERLFNAPLDTADDVVRMVRRMSNVAIGEVVRPLSVGESERIKVYAESHGISYETALRQYVDPLLDQFLDGV